MKQLFSKVLAGLLVVCTMAVAAAAEGNFVPSVEYKGAPELMDAVDASGSDVTSWVIVTPYSQRHTLPDHHTDHFDNAFSDVDMKTLYRMLEEAEHDLPESDEHLVISDLFYVHEFEDRQMIQLPVTVTFQTTLGPHAYLKVFEYINGEWQILPVTISAGQKPLRASANDTAAIMPLGAMTLRAAPQAAGQIMPLAAPGEFVTITAQVNQWGPFAIVTDITEESSAVPSPKTGADHSMLGVVIAIAACAGLAMLIKKQNANV